MSLNKAAQKIQAVFYWEFVLLLVMSSNCLVRWEMLMKVLMTIILIMVWILSIVLFAIVEQCSIHADRISREKLSGVNRKECWTRKRCGEC